MKLLHTMIRVNDLDESIRFYCDLLGMQLLRKKEYPSGRFTLAFVGYGSEAENAVVELTHNWDTHQYDVGNAFGHLAVGVSDIYATCETLRGKGAKIVREPGPKARDDGDRLRRRSQRLQDRAHPDEILALVISPERRGIPRGRSAICIDDAFLLG